MSKLNIEGFLSNPFFVALKIERKTKEIEFILNQSIQYGNNEECCAIIYGQILEEYLLQNKGLTECGVFHKEYENIIRNILLDYLVEEDCLKFFLNYDENAKVIELIKRKQYDSKLIKQALSRVGYFISYVTSQSIKSTNLSQILYRDIKKRIAEYNDNYVLAKLKPLKVIVDKVASGVKTECYLEFDKGYFQFSRNIDKDWFKEVRDYIHKKHGYKSDMNIGWVSSFLFGRSSDAEVLSLAVINNPEFWRFGPIDDKTFLSFAFLVAKYNGLKHAEKLIDYAFEQVCKDPVGKYLYDNKLSLYISLSPYKRMIDYCVYRLNNRLSSVTTKKIEESDYNGFLYPLYNGYEKQVQIGEAIFKDFIKKAYPNNSDKIFEIFEQPETIIQDENEEKRKRCLTLKTMLEAEFFTYEENSELSKFMYGYHTNFGDVKSILGRMYYRCYIIDKLTDRISNECLYEIFFDIFQMIECKFGIRCSYTTNHELRDKNYDLLKGILKKYDFELDDNSKSRYITALLDRKYASFEEVELFPQLEQFGDAVYELAVDNIFFYNPNTTLDHQQRESLVKAEFQIKVSKKIGIKDLYISNLHNSLNSKYHNYERIDFGLQNELTGDYIAASLEMVIGALAMDFGVQKAVDFATKIILETNPNLEAPHFEKFDIVALNNSNIDKDYLNKIYPSPFSFEDNDYYYEYNMLGYTLSKLLKICIIGNDTKEKRQMISHDLNHILEPKDFYEYVVSYLYYGIEETIKKYQFKIKSGYNDMN